MPLLTTPLPRAAQIWSNPPVMTFTLPLNPSSSARLFSIKPISVPEIAASYQAPFPDYTIEGLEKIGEIAALAIGIIITLVVAYIVAILLRRRLPPEKAP